MRLALSIGNVEEPFLQSADLYSDPSNGNFPHGDLNEAARAADATRARNESAPDTRSPRVAGS
jgi:hypothetical protein